jgi:preprotein translocase subunit SecG
MNQSKEVLKSKGARNPMENLIWLLGFVLFYFAMQLWILPKLGIPT